LEPLRRTATPAGRRIRVSACWSGKDDPWIGLLGSVANLVDAALRNRHYEKRAEPPPTLDPFMLELEGQLERMAAGDLAILISGESGTGKEVASRRVHAAAGGPFVDLNCAALPRDLLESELFGVEKGVATGVDARPGKFELAHGGTLFLDEIGDMAPDTQAKVLRVIQEGEVFRLGGEKPRPARPRVVAATNVDLRSQLGERFRADLFHRLAGFEARLAPLRRRTADVVNLAVCFMDRALARQGLDTPGVSPEAARALRQHDWPGNIRQLEREMERAALFLEAGEVLGVRHLSLAPAEESAEDLSLAEVLQRTERRLLTEALEKSGGDAPRAAEDLGVARSTFYRRLKELGVEAGS
ncbi:MAG: sigma 54-interacting transcriptional regulator, partial [Acidobacteriota bacterium]